MNWFTNVAVTAQAVVIACQRRGVDAEQLLDEAGLAPAILRNPDARLTVDEMSALWRAAERLSGDRYLALHSAESLEFGAYKALDFLVATAATAGDAFRRLAGYLPLINDWLTIAIVPAGEDFALEIRSPLGTPPSCPVEYTFAAIVLRSREASAIDWRPVSVEFEHSGNDDLGEFRRVFGCPVSFDAGRSRLVVSRSFWDTALPTANPALSAVLEDYAQRLLAEWPLAHDLIAQVRWRIGTRIAEGPPPLGPIAGELGMTARTLQRRLGATATSYRELGDGVRRDLARSYVSDPDIALTDVAYLLGFAEQSSFTRAFKRWTGLPPARYRALARATEAGKAPRAPARPAAATPRSGRATPHGRRAAKPHLAPPAA